MGKGEAITDSNYKVLTLLKTKHNNVLVIASRFSSKIHLCVLNTKYLRFRNRRTRINEKCSTAQKNPKKRDCIYTFTFKDFLGTCDKCEFFLLGKYKKTIQISPTTSSPQKNLPGTTCSPHRCVRSAAATGSAAAAASSFFEE